ncbi:MAG: hypothetical protein KDE09_18650, partial [Anaerolineales bacterium]|nr:hypothetical protein [Anaerolineales bacterium]
RFRGTIQAGIYQQICANPGWCYELSGSYHLPAGGQGHARIGIDPLGGTDPSAASIVWVEGPVSNVWRPLNVQAVAQARQITLFLGGVERHGSQNRIFWDRVGLCARQPYCPEPVEPEPEPCEEICIDFNDLPKPHVYTAPFSYKSLTITPLGQTVRAQDLGDPAGQLKLVFPREGVRVDFPVPLTELELTVNNYAGRTLRIVVFDGAAVIQDFTAVVANEVRTLNLTAPQMTAVAVMGGDNEASIVRLCTCLDPEIVRKIRAEG